MGAISGKIARLGMTAATPTSSTNQAATLAAGGVNLTINATGRRRWDPSSTLAGIRVYGTSTSTPYAASLYAVDHAIGRIRFSPAKSTSVTYTLDVPWLASSYIGHSRAWSLETSVDQLDVTAFSTGTDGASYRTFVPGLSQASVTVSRFVVGGGTGGESTGPIFVDRQALNSPFYLDLVVNATDQGRYVCYGHVAGIQTNESVGETAVEEITFKPTGAVYWAT